MGLFGKMMSGAISVVKSAVKNTTKVVGEEIKNEIKNEVENGLVATKQEIPKTQERISSGTTKQSKAKSVEGIKVYNFIDDLIGDNYLEVKEALEAYGFTNIAFVAKKDLKTDLKQGLFFKETNDFEDGEVEKISINGDTEFSKNDRFLPTDRVVIVYHAYKANN